MSTESFNRTSEIVETPSQYVETPKRVNVDVLKPVSYTHLRAHET